MTWHNTALDVLERLPQNAISRAVGRLVRARLPRPLAQLSVSAFARAMRIDVGEAERPLAEYASVHDFFVRKLRAGARRIDPRPNVWVSPCDGVVGEFGRIDKGTLLQAKGRTYTLAAFVQDEARAKALNGGTFVTIYLSPRHYHRVHSPLAADVEAADHIPGQLLPVNMRSINHFDGVFVRNERLAVWLRTAAGMTGVVLVGATCVGEMSAAFDDTLVTNRPIAGVVRRTYNHVHLNKGAELGTFHMGSTVVVLVPGAPRIAVQVGQEVKLGEALLES
jgi:phosphatidylserine decarboxylase